MSKRIYIIIAVLLFFLGAYFSVHLVPAMGYFVLRDYPFAITVGPPQPADSAIYWFFCDMLPIALVCAAVPIAFMIIRNYYRATVVVVLSFAGVIITLFAIRYLIHSRPEYLSGRRHLEIVPWVSLAITVLGTVLLKPKGKKISQQGAPADAKRPRR